MIPYKLSKVGQTDLVLGFWSEFISILLHYITLHKLHSVR